MKRNPENIPADMSDVISIIKKKRKEKKAWKRRQKAKRLARMTPGERKRRKWIILTGILGIIIWPLWIITGALVISNSIDRKIALLKEQSNEQ